MEITTATVERKLTKRAEELSALINRAVIRFGIVTDMEVYVPSETIRVPWRGSWDIGGTWSVTVSNKQVCVQHRVTDDAGYHAGYWETHIIDHPGTMNDTTKTINMSLPQRRWNQKLDIESLSELKRFFDIEQDDMDLIQFLIDHAVLPGESDKVKSIQQFFANV